MNSSAAMTRFEHVSALGSGGFGAVFEAIDRRTGQRVAVKELDHPSAPAIARFKQEFRTLADCHHPNLVGLKELIEQEGRWLIVMELVAGSDLATYVRGPSAGAVGAVGFDEGRLRGAISGMAEGLRALHGYGILHRDLKPTNVRVRPDGRAVLLDFGLATSIDATQGSGVMVGTVRYMAPEQAAGQQVGPPADVYALGVCLFEALTGRTPFEGERAVQILVDKQKRPAPRASSLEPHVPHDLDALCARMLATSPADRPTLDEILFVLGGEAGEQVHARRSLPAPIPAAQEVFAGRDRELERLSQALDETQRGALRIVLVEGESGMGKSELVAEFLRRERDRHEDLVALRGRCYENEQVSYKAFDGCIDELARLMSRMPEHESAALLPVRAALLAQLFPVLHNIKAIARAPRERTSADLAARRLEAFGALAALLQKLAERQRLVLVVDDLQWADVESFRMLQALAAHAARPRLLLLATVRPESELDAEVAAQLAAVRGYRQTSVIELGGLSKPQARTLAARLLGADAPASWLDVIAEESAGHPLFLGELVQYTRTHRGGATGKLTLDAALRARIERLAPRPRELLELAALATRPHGSHVFARALALPQVDEPARTLLAEKLLRLRKSQELGCYHDRIRRSVIELLSPERAVDLHRRLAGALATVVEMDPVEQAHHWDLSGARQEAIVAYELAITRALETLAFARAARLCARAIELVDASTDPRTQHLLAQRAHALACTGHSAEAAALYRQAAEGAEGELRIRLRSRFAQQLMLSGNLKQGFAAARALLIELGISMPLGRAGLLLRFAWDRLCLALRDSLAQKRTLMAGTPHQPLASEVIDELIHGVWLAHPLSMLTLTTQQMRLTRGAGTAERSAIAATTNGWLLTVGGSLAKALPLFESSRALLKDSPNAYDLGLQAYLEGSARMAGFDWIGGSACLLRAQELVQEHCPEWPWLITNIRYHLGVAWYQLGEYQRIAQHAEGWLADARARNNALGVALLTGMGHAFVRHLMADAPETALVERERALVAISPEPFAFIHLGHFMSKCTILFYQGGPRALQYIERFDAEHAHTPFLKLSMPREVRLSFRAAALLHACAEATPDERAARLESAEALARKLARGSPLMRAFGLLTQAQVAALSGRRERALAQARAARMQFELIGHGMRRHALYLEGLLEGGRVGEEKQRDVLAVFAEQGFRVPERALQLALGALPLLQNQERLSISARTPRVLGRYQLLAPLERDRLASARELETGKEVVLRALRVDEEASSERFRSAFHALQELRHANLARLESLVEYEGRWFVALEQVAGVDLLTYARRRGRCDPLRLAAACLGVARGLLALERLGLAHGALTPSSVRVTEQGRAVLIDFGCGEPCDTPVPKAEAGGHAAPERLAGAVPGARSDVYALGACMHEALFGTLPLPAGDATQAARQPGASSSSELEPLGAVCARMLAREPAERPTLPALIDALGSVLGRALPSAGASFERVAVPESRFVGREDELSRLASAFERTCDDGFTVVMIEGESGVGKSALASEFARQAKHKWPSVHVLMSRCHESERVAYKAFDGVVEQLAALLCTLPNPQCEALVPEGGALLGNLFPVLMTVPAIAQAPRGGLPADPAAQKLAARTCFVTLLENLSARHELLFVVDDLQWADGESFALLRTLSEQRQRLPLLFVGTVHETFARGERQAVIIEELCVAANVERIALAGLTETAASHFATALHGGTVPAEQLATWLHESKGHPLFLRELVAHAKRGDASDPVVTLDDALRSHVASLPTDARELLALLAVAGRPLSAHVCAHARNERELPRETVVTLLNHALVQRRGGQALACYHDRIRSVLLTTLPPAARKKHAADLADALDHTHAGDAAERARLWDEAGQPDRAWIAYEEAGDHALAGLAFTRAEQHYGRALALLDLRADPDCGDERGRLLEKRGQALVRSGKSAEAARLFREAAAFATGEAQVRLRIWAAQHLIQSAQVDEGLRTASTLLAELGVPLPRSDRAALARIAWERTRLSMRGTELVPVAKPSSSRERLVLQALHELGPPVRALSYLHGSTLTIRYLRRALVAGDPIHAARALAYEGLFRVLQAPQQAQRERFEQSRALAAAAGDPALMAEVELCIGLACLAQSEFRAAPRHLAAAHELLETRCPGQPWLRTTVRMHLGSAWFYAGDWAAITRSTGAFLEEARARDDRYASAALLGSGCAYVRHLVANQPDTALYELEQAMANWPDKPFTSVHFGAFTAKACVLIYSGGRAALDWLDRERARVGEPYLLRTEPCRFAIDSLAALAVTRALEVARDGERSPLLARGAALVRSIERCRSPGAGGVALLFRGVFEGALGRRDEAERCLAAAAAEETERGSVWSLGARYLDGVMRGGASGGAARERVVAELRAGGWVDMDRALTLHVPGLHLFE